MRGRGKGSQFERDLCRELSLWWTRRKRDDVFWRTSQSGGRSKTRLKSGKRTFGQYGDVQAVDPRGRPFLEVVTIEAKKGYGNESVWNAVDKLPRGGKLCPSQWERFLAQVLQDMTNADTPFWMLFHKRDSRANVVFIPEALYMILPGLGEASPGAMIRIPSSLQAIFSTTWAEFQRLVDPDDFRSIAKAHKRGRLEGKVIKFPKRVVRCRRIV